MNNRLVQFAQNELMVIQRGLVDVCEECLTLAMHPTLRGDIALDTVADRFMAAGGLMTEIDDHLGNENPGPAIFMDVGDHIRDGDLDALEAALEVLP